VLVNKLSKHVGFNEVFEKRFWNFLEEINYQVLYRKEYVKQNDGEDMEAYKDNGDKP